MTVSRRVLHAGGGVGSFAPPTNATILDRMSSWWVSPKAVECNGRVNVSGVTSGGAVRVDSVAVDDHTDVTTRLLMTAESDDHNAAALVIPTDKPPIVFYARHNQDNYLRYRPGTTIGDITSLVSPDVTITLSGPVTYAQAWRRPGTDEIHAFARESLRYWVYVWSDDWFATNEAPRRAFDFGASQQGYIGTVPIAADPSRLRVALTGHPTSSTFHDIYYCEIDLETGDIINQADTTLGNLRDGTNLPLAVTSLDKIVDTDTAGGHNCRLFDVGDGPEPEVAYADWTSDTNTIYYRTVYSGGSWAASPIVAAGVTFGYYANIHYNGGVMFPHDTPGDTVYLSREAAGIWTVEKRVYNGSVWQLTRTLASGASKFVRPQPIVNPTRGVLTWHDVASYPVTATASLDWEADLVIAGS